MKKKGQVTLFIIIALVAVALVVLFFVFKDNVLPQNSSNIDSSSVGIFVIDCIESIGEDALYAIGQNGGYYLPSENSNSLGVAYYFLRGENVMPSKERIEKEIEEYVDDALSLCTEDFVEFKDFNISQEKVQSKAFIFEDKVILDVNYPIRIEKGEDVVILKKFEGINFPMRLGEMYSIMGSLIQKQVENSGDICISCMLELEERNFSFSMKSEETSLIYNFFENRYLLENTEGDFEPSPYVFRFAIEI